LRTHHGAVDQDALTSQAPLEIMEQVKQVLDELGLEYKRENNEYKLRITRKRRAPELGNTPQQNRRNVIYGDPLVDSGDEVRFSVEICRIKNLPGLYIVDMRRLRGNVWAYKFLYRSLMKKLELGGREKYLNNNK
ncbi:hypothetical protein K501DRAFT_203789, partial [Backusella circina FSU 941]